MATTYVITVANILAWNPELNAQCTNLAAGSSYCVWGVSEYGFVSGVRMIAPLLTPVLSVDYISHDVNSDFHGHYYYFQNDFGDR